MVLRDFSWSCVTFHGPAWLRCSEAVLRRPAARCIFPSQRSSLTRQRRLRSLSLPPLALPPATNRPLLLLPYHCSRCNRDASAPSPRAGLDSDGARLALRTRMEPCLHYGPAPVVTEAPLPRAGLDSAGRRFYYSGEEGPTPDKSPPAPFSDAPKKGRVLAAYRLVHWLSLHAPKESLGSVSSRVLASVLALCPSLVSRRVYHRCLVFCPSLESRVSAGLTTRPPLLCLASLPPPPLV